MLVRAVSSHQRGAGATIDGEAVVRCPKTGLSLFDRLHSGRFDREVVLYGFDLLELDGDDLRPRPLEQRKARLAELLAPITGGIELSEHIEADGACKLAARASSRNGAMRPTDRAGCGPGSRSRPGKPGGDARVGALNAGR